MIIHPSPQSRPISLREALVDVMVDPAEMEWLFEKAKGSLYRFWAKTNVGRTLESVAGKGHLFNHAKLDPRKPCRTVTKESGNASLVSLGHWSEKRILTTNEIKRVMSFPDQYVLNGTYREKIGALGNAVAPLMMRAIALSIRKNVFKYKIENCDLDIRKPYKQILDYTWQEHLKEKGADAPTVISTFAGCGGSSLGYSMAGFRELMAVEITPRAVEIFKDNFKDVYVYNGDICNIKSEDILKRTKLNVGDLDVFDGSPPCQGFSNAGNRCIDDERNVLYQQFTRLLSDLKPKTFVIENVNSIATGRTKKIFSEIIQDLRSKGYAVSARVLDAQHYFVPRRRKRMIFIGIRNDLGIDPRS